MTEAKTVKDTKVIRQRLLAEFRRAPEDASLVERMEQLGIPPQERTEAVSLALSVLLERMDDIGRDLVRAREEFAELEQLVDVDCLVPVPNRRAFMRRLQWAVSMFQRYGHPCSVIFFDLNGFKRINDEYSHAAGDEVIRKVAEVLAASLRASDFMARLGGDEFVVLLYHARQDAAKRRASMLAKRVAAQAIEWQGVTLSVTTSYGTYEVREGDTADSVLACADEAMYQQKRSLVKT